MNIYTPFELKEARSPLINEVVVPTTPTCDIAVAGRETGGGSREENRARSKSWTDEWTESNRNTYKFMLIQKPRCLILIALSSLSATPVAFPKVLDWGLARAESVKNQRIDNNKYNMYNFNKMLTYFAVTGPKVTMVTCHRNAPWVPRACRINFQIPVLHFHPSWNLTIWMSSEQKISDAELVEVLLGEFLRDVLCWREYEKPFPESEIVKANRC